MMESTIHKVIQDVQRTEHNVTMLLDSLRQEAKKVEEERDALKVKERELVRFENNLITKAAELRDMHVNILKNQEPKVTINVGGVIVVTFYSTLAKYPESMLAAMFSGRHHTHKDDNGAYFLDRDPDIFIHILNYLRTGKLAILEISTNAVERAQILDELDYFCIPRPKLEPLGLRMLTVDPKSPSKWRQTPVNCSADIQVVTEPYIPLLNCIYTTAAYCFICATRAVVTFVLLETTEMFSIDISCFHLSKERVGGVITKNYAFEYVDSGLIVGCGPSHENPQVYKIALWNLCDPVPYRVINDTLLAEAVPATHWVVMYHGVLCFKCRRNNPTSMNTYFRNMKLGAEGSFKFDGRFRCRYAGFEHVILSDDTTVYLRRCLPNAKPLKLNIPTAEYTPTMKERLLIVRAPIANVIQKTASQTKVGISKCHIFTLGDSTRFSLHTTMHWKCIKTLPSGRFWPIFDHGCTILQLLPAPSSVLDFYCRITIPVENHKMILIGDYVVFVFDSGFVRIIRL